jgi:hypothetical protein
MILLLLFFSEYYLELLIQILQYVVHDSFQVDHIIREVLEEGRASFQKISVEGGSAASTSTSTLPRTKTQTFMFFWQTIMLTFLFVFFASSISQFAQYYQMNIDNEEINDLRDQLELLIKNGSKDSLTSSASDQGSSDNELHLHSSVLSPHRAGALSPFSNSSISPLSFFKRTGPSIHYTRKRSSSSSSALSALLSTEPFITQRNRTSTMTTTTPQSISPNTIIKESIMENNKEK